MASIHEGQPGTAWRREQAVWAALGVAFAASLAGLLTVLPARPAGPAARFVLPPARPASGLPQSGLAKASPLLAEAAAPFLIAERTAAAHAADCSTAARSIDAGYRLRGPLRVRWIAGS